MLKALARKWFGSANDRLIAQLQKTVEKVNALESEMAVLSDSALQAKTDDFKAQLASGKSLDELIPDIFAVVREASKRVLAMRHFDVQLLGGLVLHQGMISEMKTGEGKTLVATLAVYLNALAGKGVHVVTVNDYLAKRDAEWMGQLYGFLGMKTGCIVAGISEEERKAAYLADITYGTNNEFAFDYLRDNMKFSLSQRVQRPFHYAIVDEVDSILVDEARTPLIISGAAEDSSELYIACNKIIPKLSESHYEKDEKNRTITLTEDGTLKVEELLTESGLLGEGQNLYEMQSIYLVHHINQALKAHHLFAKDVDYIVKDHQVLIIDEFTGRMMEGRRFSEGLHQALEAKEDVPIQQENQTLASITFQNYFRLYPKLAGMTGTAMTEANEFADIYRLEVVEIPTNVSVLRIDEDDDIYRTAKEKYDAIIDLIQEAHELKQPVLVGTVSIEKSEYLSSLLKKKHIAHHVLNARYHEQEAHIIAQAGRPGAVTIATNMAGRGTDIMLGGNALMQLEEVLKDYKGKDTPEQIKQRVQAEVAHDKKVVLEAGGLLVIGTERHESRRIDNQLRGRSGRQGDPGRTKFFLSLDDDLMRIFGSERISGLLEKLGLKEGESINHPWITKTLERAQSKVEARNYEVRKNLLKFDDVMNDQRKVIYEQRIELMEAEQILDTVEAMREEVNHQLVQAHIPEHSYADQWDIEGLEKEIYRIYGVKMPVADWAAEEGIADQEICEKLDEQAKQIMQEKENRYGSHAMREVEKRVVLISLDQLWKDHLLTLDHLRQGISLRAYGQKDPLNEYKREAFQLFEAMLDQLREVVTGRLAHVVLQGAEAEGDMAAIPEMAQVRMHEGREDPAMMAAMRQQARAHPDLQEARRQVVPLVTVRNHVNPGERIASDPTTWGKVSRNESCPCGSGKKYKQCHGVLS